MHPLLLYAAIRQDQAEHHRRVRLERTVAAARRDDIATRSPGHGRPRWRPVASARRRLERMTARLAGRQTGRA